MEGNDPEGVLPEAQRRLLLLGVCATAVYDYRFFQLFGEAAGKGPLLQALDMRLTDIREGSECR